MNKTYVIKKKGFSLIELMVVVAIIGILVGIVTVNMQSAKENSRDKKRQADLYTISGALQLYYSEKKTYPILGENVSDLRALLVADYLNTLPSDPKGGEYSYKYYSEDGSWFVLDAKMERDKVTIPNLNDPKANRDLGEGTYAHSDGSNHFRIVGQ